jgi:hypothetical protein
LKKEVEDLPRKKSYCSCERVVDKKGCCCCEGGGREERLLWEGMKEEKVRLRANEEIILYLESQIPSFPQLLNSTVGKEA